MRTSSFILSAFFALLLVFGVTSAAQAAIGDVTINVKDTLGNYLTSPVFTVELVHSGGNVVAVDGGSGDNDSTVNGSIVFTAASLSSFSDGDSVYVYTHSAAGSGYCDVGTSSYTTYSSQTPTLIVNGGTVALGTATNDGWYFVYHSATGTGESFLVYAYSYIQLTIRDQFNTPMPGYVLNNHTTIQIDGVDYTPDYVNPTIGYVLFNTALAGHASMTSVQVGIRVKGFVAGIYTTISYSQDTWIGNVGYCAPFVNLYYNAVIDGIDDELGNAITMSSSTSYSFYTIQFNHTSLLWILTAQDHGTRYFSLNSGKLYHCYLR